MKASKKQIEVVTTLDANYLQHCGVMLCSLFRNNPESKFHVYLIIGFANNADLARLNRFVSLSGHVLHVIRINDSQLNAFKTVHHITTATYFRLLIPSLVNPNLSKILYLDVDIVVRKDITALWTTDLTGYALAAVTESLLNQREPALIPQGKKYFNAGMMLLNLTNWRENTIAEKVLQYLQVHHASLEMLEQDALNALLYDKWLELSAIWNQTNSLYELAGRQPDQVDEAVSESLKDPALVHYTGSSKPWHYHNAHPFKQEYYKYLAFTPWRGFKHPEDTIWHSAKQYAKQMLNLVSRKRKYEVYP